MNKDKFEIEYWGRDYFYTFPQEKSTRSLRKKLFIVFSFVGTLALLPLAILTYSGIKSAQPEKVSVVTKPQVFENKKTVNQNTVENPDIMTVEVLNNDSYWKISKRVCGTGKNYLSIREINNAKPLLKGDAVRVSCN